LKGKGVEIDRRKISVKEGDIKEVGSYTVVIALTKEQSVELPLEIFAE
jgi:ribosomal protein L9